MSIDPRQTEQAAVHEIFIHLDGRPPARTMAGATETIAEVLVRAGVPASASHTVFVGEPLEDANDLDGAEHPGDLAHPVVLAVTIAELAIGRVGHLHCRRHPHVQVRVNFEHRHHEHKFSAAVKLRRVRHWALDVFELKGSDAEKLVLQICGSDERPAATSRLGEYARSDDCGVCFDLVFPHRVEG